MIHSASGWAAAVGAVGEVVGAATNFRWNDSPVSVLGRGRRVDIVNAAFLNCFSASLNAFDDTHLDIPYVPRVISRTDASVHATLPVGKPLGKEVQGSLAAGYSYVGGRPLPFGETAAAPSRGDVLRALIPYAEQHLAAGGRLNNIVRHVLGLYHGQPRARQFRRFLSERAPRDGAGVDVLRAAIEIVDGTTRARDAAA